jgi:predicted phage terminase large subunit-like protein
MTGDKTTRAGPAAVQAEAGYIKLVRGPWNDAFLEEAATFPSGRHDDQIDCLSNAINHLTANRGIDYSAW